MTDQIPADLHPDDVALARDFAEEYRDSEYAPDRTLAVARVLQALLPAPPLPTLADMTSEERDGCQRMQCDVGGEDTRAVIFNPHWENGSARVMWPSGFTTYPNWEQVTPRPDLPRLEWPGDTPAPTLPDGWRPANHPRYGRVFVTTPEPDCEGDLWFIDPSAAPGSMEDWCDSDVLTFLDANDEDGDTNE